RDPAGNLRRALQFGEGGRSLRAMPGFFRMAGRTGGDRGRAERPPFAADDPARGEFREARAVGGPEPSPAKRFQPFPWALDGDPEARVGGRRLTEALISPPYPCLRAPCGARKFPGSGPNSRILSAPGSGDNSPLPPLPSRPPDSSIRIPVRRP